MLTKRMLQIYVLPVPNHNFQFLISSEKVSITILFMRS